MSVDQVLEWARRMGYPGVDDPEFQENLHRLVIPQTKHMWRHLTTCVRPADEASKIKKQLLCYKLSVEGNPTHEALEKFDNVMDYEAFLKKRTLEAKIDHLNEQIGQKKKLIEFTNKKLKESEEQKRVDAALKKEKIEKLRLLRLKNEELRGNVQQFQDLSSIAAEFTRPSYTSTNQDAEVSQLISSLEPGCEVEQMCSHVSNTIKTLAEIIQSEKRSSLSSLESEEMSLHQDLENHFSRIFSKVEELRNNRDKLKEELDKEKRYLEPADLDLAQRVKASFIQSGRFDLLIEAEEQQFLKSWISSNVVPITDDSSAFSESFVNTDFTLSQTLSNLKYYNSFPAAQLKSSLAEYVKKSRTEAAKSPRRDIGVVVDRILTSLPQLIDMYIKSPNIMSNSSSSVAVSNPIHLYNSSKSAQLHKALANKFPQFELTRRHNFPEPVALLYSIESHVARQKNVVFELFKEIDAYSQRLDALFESTSSHLNNWSKYPVHAVLPDAPEFHDSVDKVKICLSSLRPDERDCLVQNFISSIDLNEPR